MIYPTNNTDYIHAKPKLAFFQYKYDERLPAFLVTHKREHVKCLSQFFDVTLITGDCDYEKICDTYQPDIALFESGVKDYPTHERPKITNLGAHPQVPKVGLHRQDSFCRARAGFLSDMDHWGIETYFAIATTAAEHMPDIADRLFIWPNFVDATIYRDYGESKVIPVLFAGNASTLYPWRQRVIKLITRYYPSLICPHPGYEPGSPVPQIMLGERYARTINASLVAPACGTVVNEVVRKHFEIPACNTCLITERTPAVESAGFVDMANCVFADEHDIVDKLAFLFEHPDELRRITNAGHDLVHSRHTLSHRDQVFQWFSLYKSRKADQKIVQLGPFEPLLLVPQSSGICNSHITSHGLHLALLREGDEKLWAGKFADAEERYLKCLHYLPWMPEPKLRLALFCLYTGNAKRAVSWLDEPLNFILFEYKASDPDPVEWAYFIISLLCLGKMDEAVRRASEFPWLRHPELDRARWIACILGNGEGGASLVSDDESRYRPSVHHLPSRSLDEWIEHLCAMLKACGQHSAVATLARSSYSPRESRAKRHGDAEVPANSRKQLPDHGYVRTTNTLNVFKRRIFYRTLKARVRGSVARVFHRLESKVGYFLPYRYSEARKDDFFCAIQSLARSADVDTALIIGAARGEHSTEALLAGANDNPRKPSVFCIDGARHEGLRTHANSPTVKWYQPLSSAREDLPAALEQTVDKIKSENGITSFDLLLIADSTLARKFTPVTSIANTSLRGTRFIFLDGAIAADIYQVYTELLRDPDYALVDHNPNLRNGYVIFERTDRVRAEQCAN